MCQISLDLMFLHIWFTSLSQINLQLFKTDDMSGVPRQVSGFSSGFGFTIYIHLHCWSSANLFPRREKELEATGRVGDIITNVLKDSILKVNECLQVVSNMPNPKQPVIPARQHELCQGGSFVVGLNLKIQIPSKAQTPKLLSFLLFLVATKWSLHVSP